MDGTDQWVIDFNIYNIQEWKVESNGDNSLEATDLIVSGYYFSSFLVNISI